MNLLIDIGNSRTKIALADFAEINQVTNYNKFNKSVLSSCLMNNSEIQFGIISAVKELDKALIKFIASKVNSLTILDKDTPLPYRNNYRSKNSLGNDRIAALAGACNIFPGENVLVIDAGTAITFDMLSDTGEFHRGNISPGLFMRFKALHTFTGNLPDLEPAEMLEKFGTDTNSAIRAGVQYGILYEMERYVNDFTQKYPGGKIIITGGDANFFAGKLKKHIFVEPNLILKGLNFILKHNVSI